MRFLGLKLKKRDEDFDVLTYHGNRIYQQQKRVGGTDKRNTYMSKEAPGSNQ